MCTATCLLETGAGIILVNLTLLPPQWTTRIKRKKVLLPHTATQEPLRMGETILLHVRLRKLCVKVWCSIVHNLAVDMLTGTSFIDRFIREIFQAERKFVPLHSHPEAIFSATQRDQHICKSSSHVAAPLGKPSNDDEDS